MHAKTLDIELQAFRVTKKTNFEREKNVAQELFFKSEQRE